jgi:hypothetical protein
MAKLKLTVNPTVQAKVGIPLASGDKTDVLMTFKHRTRTEFAELMASFTTKPEEVVSVGDDPAAAARAGLKKDIDAVLSMVSAWDLEDEFNRDNVELLLENYFGAASAIYETYGQALQGARRGN